MPDRSSCEGRKRLAQRVYRNCSNPFMQRISAVAGVHDTYIHPPRRLLQSIRIALVFRQETSFSSSQDS